jgi:D-alanyl-D-alanine carboxypeptidase/D-alanyl-D-alanine-endopeptidase (penicillin-binding protein 4)
MQVSGRSRWSAWALGLGLALAATPAPADSPKTPSSQRATASPVQRQLDQMSRWVLQHKGRISALVVELDTGRVLAAHDESIALNPASNAKILTAATALARLGPDFRFTSGVYGTIEDGSAARLVLRSNGDPSLSTRDLEQMVKKLVAAGLSRVGEILVDQSHFDQNHLPPAFGQQPNEWAAFRAPVSAVALDENSFVVSVEPAPVGKPATVRVDPPGFVDLDSEVTTVEAGKRRRLRIAMKPKGALLSAKLTGFIASDVKHVSFRKRIDDPSLYAGYVLRALLKREGVAADVAVKEGGHDEKAALVEQKSEPLSTLIRELGKNSDNFYAEMLLKSVAAEMPNGVGSSSAGAGLVVEWMKSVGAHEASVRIVNGSGLFDSNRVSAASLVAALRAARSDPKAGAAFVDQLSQGGVDGTLKNRFRGKRVRRRVRAKTGTLARAHALSGFVLGKDDRHSVAFAVIVNGIAGHASEQRQHIDRVVEKAAADASN